MARYNESRQGYGLITSSDEGVSGICTNKGPYEVERSTSSDATHAVSHPLWKEPGRCGVDILRLSIAGVCIGDCMACFHACWISEKI